MPGDPQDRFLAPTQQQTQLQNALGPGSRTTSGSYSSSMLIEEVGSVTGQSARSVTLNGPALPFMGAEWAGANNIKTKWYPGNPDEATQQWLGPTELPSKWTGEWNRTRMSRAPSLAVTTSGASITVIDPDVLAQLLEDMFRGGIRLRVTWTVTGDQEGMRGKKVREGRAREWHFKYTRIQDIQWDVDYEWVGRGIRTQKVTPVRDASLDAATAALNVAGANFASFVQATSFIASNAAIYHSASTFTLGQLEALANAPTLAVQSVLRNLQQSIGQLQQVAAIGQTLASQPQQIAQAASNFARNTIAIANQFNDSMGQTPVEAMATSTNVVDMLRAQQYIAQAQARVELIAQAALALDIQMRLKAPAPQGTAVTSGRNAPGQDGDVIAIYITKDGDTPQRISQRYYSTPDHAVDILQANKLPWYQATFPTRMALIIPALRTSTRGP